ncbi:MAG: hypothetical protein KKF48_02415 [Nanoarchaeota archaeon]|nr:hypothetical protein [Nanoarchaeota archaeon]MBU1027874.1 hypothetical protein [Nanoarchaeota archaeon]
MEKEYSQLTKEAKRGLNKFANLHSSKCMKQYGDKFENKTGKSSYNVENKEEFFTFVAKEKIKGCK